jgi:hypothetical protein
MYRLQLKTNILFVDYEKVFDKALGSRRMRGAGHTGHMGQIKMRTKF